MKIEMCENSMIAAVVAIIAILIMTTAMTCCSITETTRQKEVAAGLVEKPGSAQKTWTKP